MSVQADGMTAALFASPWAILESSAPLEAATATEIDHPHRPREMHPFLPGHTVNFFLDFIDNAFLVAGVIIKLVDGPAVGIIHLPVSFINISRRLEQMSKNETGARII